MTITLAEFEKFSKSIELLNKLRSIPLEIIEYYLENEHGYVVKKSESNEEKTVIVRPSRLPEDEEGQGEGASR
jgi:hypothetical protein